MPHPNSDKENYTIDEMMGRLKQRPESEPELVTRSDGSQALKVRKRKRRTDQSGKKETSVIKRSQVIQIAAVVVVLMLLLIVMGVGILYVNSASYRDSLTAKLGVSSGAKVDIKQFRMNPLAAHASGSTLDWPAGNVLEKLEIGSVSAKISPATFVGSKFSGEEIVAANGKLFLKSSDPSEPLRVAPAPEGDLPVKFARYAVPSLDIQFGASGGITKTEASLFPGTVAGQAELRLSGGVMKLADWPALKLDRSYIKFRDAELNIQSMRFLLPDSERQGLGGYIDFSGSLAPVGDSGTQTLSAKLGDFPLSYLLGGDLGRFFAGKVDSAEIPDSNFLSLDLGASEDAKLEMTVTNAPESRVDVSGFRFLQMLALAFNDRWYEFPIFDDDVSMVVKRVGQDVDVSDLNLVKRGRMVVRGSVSNGEGGAIKGKLSVGIPDTTIIASGDKKLARMFGPVREGYRWVDLEITGTGALPEDDFRTIYADTGSGEATAPGNGNPPDSFEELIEEK